MQKKRDQLICCMRGITLERAFPINVQTKQGPKWSVIEMKGRLKLSTLEPTPLHSKSLVLSFLIDCGINAISRVVISFFDRSTSLRNSIRDRLGAA